MPTQTGWGSQTTLQTVWQQPLTPYELRACFNILADEIDSAEGKVDVVFDITDAGHIPVEAPMLAVKSGFMGHTNLGQVVVIGMDSWAQILARVAARTAGKHIAFFPDGQAVAAFLAEEPRQAEPFR